MASLRHSLSLVRVLRPNLNFCSWHLSHFLPRRRCFCGASYHSIHRSLVEGLSKHSIGFPVKGSDIEVLSSPSQYLEMLKQGITDAKERIVMASLYIGTGQQEQELLNVLADSLKSKRSLQALLLFDALRSTRPTHVRDDDSFKSSADMLSRLLLSDSAKWNPCVHRLRIALYRTPDLARILEKVLPTRFNEIIGVCHIKAYIFDNLVLMSGANLSTSYFTNRQDRYMVFRDCSSLADYMCSIVETVASFSYLLGSAGNLLPNMAMVDSRDDPEGFRTSMSNAIQGLIYQTRSFQEKSVLEIQNDRLDISWLPSRCDTWVFPTVQMGSLGIEQGERSMLWFLENLPTGSFVHFSSAYFNLTPELEAALLQASLDKSLKILTAAPQANGFYGSPGVSGLIPKVYSLLEQRLYEHAEHMSTRQSSELCGVHSSEGGLQIFEYNRQNWTFHAKGIWCLIPGNNLLPSITLIGSSNFGYRSRQRDLEAQCLLVTLQPGLMESLQQEWNALFCYSKQVDKSVFLEEGRTGGPVASFAAEMVRSWL